MRDEYFPFVHILSNSLIDKGLFNFLSGLDIFYFDVNRIWYIHDHLQSCLNHQWLFSRFCSIQRSNLSPSCDCSQWFSLLDWRIFLLQRFLFFAVVRMLQKESLYIRPYKIISLFIVPCPHLFEPPFYKFLFWYIPKKNRIYNIMLLNHQMIYIYIYIEREREREREREQQVLRRYFIYKLFHKSCDSMIRI